jgi:hypothetical protein
MLHHKVAVRDEHGEIAKRYGSSIDIEDRKCVEESLRQSDFYLQEGQRLGRMGSWAFNPSGSSTTGLANYSKFIASSQTTGLDP